MRLLWTGAHCILSGPFLNHAAENMEMSNAELLEETKHEYYDSLKSLVLTLQQRVVQASNTIRLSDDPGVLESELQFINPFWDFVSSRQSLNSTEYWEDCSQTLLGDVSYDLIRVTPLAWLPQRRMLIDALQHEDQTILTTIHDLLYHVEGVVFNFVQLMSRCSFLLKIDNAGAFEIETWKSNRPEGYRLSRMSDRQNVADASGKLKLIGNTTGVTVAFVMPEGEAVRVERDYSQDPTNPQMRLRMLVESGQQRPDDRILTLTGTLREIQNGQGRVDVE